MLPTALRLPPKDKVLSDLISAYLDPITYHCLLLSVSVTYRHNLIVSLVLILSMLSLSATLGTPFLPWVLLCVPFTWFLLTPAMFPSGFFLCSFS